MKNLAIITLTLFASIGFAETSQFAQHPPVKDPIYLDPSQYANFKKETPPPPTQDSKADKDDEAELLRQQKVRTAKDCERAQGEVMVNLESMYGSLGLLTAEDIKRLMPFFEQLRNDTYFFVQKLKNDFPRQRPYLRFKNLNPCVPKETSLAYPSGHAAISESYALALGDIFPKKAAQFEARAQQIASDRVLAGVHHPTDIQVGREMAKKIYAAMKMSKRFQEDLKKLQAGKTL